MPVRPSRGLARQIAAVALAVASLIAASAVGSIFLSTARDSRAAIEAPGPASPADGILVLVALVGMLLSFWVGLGLVLTALSELPGALGQACTGLAARIAPAAVRKVVAFVLGTALTATLVPGTAVARTAYEVPGQARVTSTQYDARALGGVADRAPDASFRLVQETTHSSEVSDAAPSPSWTEGSRASWTVESRAIPSDRPDGVVVLRGDTLWSIAARQLGVGATTAEINTEWHRWFAANHHVIGNDANHIAPGQILRAPASVQGES